MEFLKSPGLNFVVSMIGILMILGIIILTIYLNSRSYKSKREKEFKSKVASEVKLPCDKVHRRFSLSIDFGEIFSKIRQFYNERFLPLLEVILLRFFQRMC